MCVCVCAAIWPTYIIDRSVIQKGEGGRKKEREGKRRGRTGGKRGERGVNVSGNPFF